MGVGLDEVREKHLVRLELDKGVARRHGVAFILQPARDRRFDDGFAERRNFDRGHEGIDSEAERKATAANIHSTSCEHSPSRRTAVSSSSRFAMTFQFPTCELRLTFAFGFGLRRSIISIYSPSQGCRE